MALAGSQPETDRWKHAIGVLETLIADQQTMTQERKHARAYVELAQLYRRAGEEDKAAEVRERGAQLFPRNPQLSGEASERP